MPLLPLRWMYTNMTLNLAHCKINQCILFSNLVVINLEKALFRSVYLSLERGIISLFFTNCLGGVKMLNSFNNVYFFDISIHIVFTKLYKCCAFTLSFFVPFTIFFLHYKSNMNAVSVKFHLFLHMRSKNLIGCHLYCKILGLRLFDEDNTKYFCCLLITHKLLRHGKKETFDKYSKFWHS